MSFSSKSHFYQALNFVSTPLNYANPLIDKQEAHSDSVRDGQFQYALSLPFTSQINYALSLMFN